MVHFLWIRTLYYNFLPLDIALRILDDECKYYFELDEDLRVPIRYEIRIGDFWPKDTINLDLLTDIYKVIR